MRVSTKGHQSTDVNVMEANLPNLFAEPGDELEEDVAWRFAGVNIQADAPNGAAAPPAPPVAVPDDLEVEDVDMGGLFGDDEDY